MKPSSLMLWSSATLMVTIVSFCSLIGVSIVPLISGPSYKTFITLFTGLAVGSLLGSAIFGLIPQAFGLVSAEDSQKAYLWKSLIIFFGIYLFYCSERLMRIYFERRTRKQQREQQIQLNKDKPSASVSATDDVNNAQRTKGGDEVNINNTHSREDAQAMTEISLTKNGDEENQAISNIFGHTHHDHHHSLNPQEVLARALKRDSTKRGNSLPIRRAQIAPLAWMIILGDGLHNFIDGLAIGAAFTESLYFGFVQSLAVICEEVPHELGDFAVLIASGMTVRQALVFNFLSACTCYIGMIIGIIVGDTTKNATSIFALAGGMFLYISLVDMMGELNAMLEEVKHSTKEAIRMLVMQNIGILSGIIIIFTLSLNSKAV